MSKQSSDFEADIGKKYAVGKLTVQIEGVVAEGMSHSFSLLTQQ